MDLFFLNFTEFLGKNENVMLLKARQEKPLHIFLNSPSEKGD